MHLPSISSWQRLSTHTTWQSAVRGGIGGCLNGRLPRGHQQCIALSWHGITMCSDVLVQVPEVHAISQVFSSRNPFRWRGPSVKAAWRASQDKAHWTLAFPVEMPSDIGGCSKNGGTCRVCRTRRDLFFAMIEIGNTSATTMKCF